MDILTKGMQSSSIHCVQILFSVHYGTIRHLSFRLQQFKSTLRFLLPNVLGFFNYHSEQTIFSPLQSNHIKLAARKYLKMFSSAKSKIFLQIEGCTENLLLEKFGTTKKSTVITITS